MRRTALALLVGLVLPLSAQESATPPTAAENAQEVLAIATEMGALMKSLGLSDEESLAAATDRLRAEMSQNPPDRDTVEEFRSAYRGQVYNHMARGLSEVSRDAPEGDDSFEPDLLVAGIEPASRPVMATNPSSATDLTLTLNRPEEAEIAAAAPRAGPTIAITPSRSPPPAGVAVGSSVGGGGGGAVAGGGGYGPAQSTSSGMWLLLGLLVACIVLLAAIIGLLLARRSR